MHTVERMTIERMDHVGIVVDDPPEWTHSGVLTRVGECCALPSWGETLAWKVSPFRGSIRR